MEIKAQTNFIRISPRKLRLIANTVKGLSLDKALISLKFLGKNGSKEIEKVLLQARGNGVNNAKVDKDKLKIKEIQVCAGPTLKRGIAVSRGMWHSVKKRTSHIKVILEA